MGGQVIYRSISLGSYAKVGPDRVKRRCNFISRPIRLYNYHLPSTGNPCGDALRSLWVKFHPGCLLTGLSRSFDYGMVGISCSGVNIKFSYNIRLVSATNPWIIPRNYDMVN